MKNGRINLIAAAIVLLLAAVGGVVLAFTLDPSLESGEYRVASQRFFFREGHSHGMPIALLNLLVGLLIPRLELGERGRRALSLSGLGTFLLPLALLLRGVTYPSKAVAPVAVIGSLCFLLTAFLILRGSWRTNGSTSP